MLRNMYNKSNCKFKNEINSLLEPNNTLQINNNNLNNKEEVFLIIKFKIKQELTNK
jgi:hypothetical protein